MVFSFVYFTLETVYKVKPLYLGVQYLCPGFPDYWFAPGARPHLLVPGVTKGKGSVFMSFHLGNKSNRGPIPDRGTWPLSTKQTEDRLRHTRGPVRYQLCNIQQAPMWNSYVWKIKIPSKHIYSQKWSLNEGEGLN